MLAEIDGMKKFAEQYGIAINDPMLIRRYRMYQDSKRDEATRFAVAEQKAASEATAKTKAEIAKGMKVENISEDVIARITGLSTEEIDAL